MPNHLAGTLDGTNGDRAQYLNQFTGLTVIAFERPGTGSLDPVSAFTPETYLDDVKQRADELHQLLDEMGIERPIICHDSAGALDALALAATGKIAAEKVIAIEPIGMKSMKFTSVKDIVRWVRNEFTPEKSKVDSEEFEQLSPLNDIRKRPGWTQIVRRVHKEGSAYMSVYFSTIGRTLLRQLAEDNVPVSLIIAEHSFATPPDQQPALIAEFDNSSVAVKVIPTANHAFSEPYHQFIHIAKKTLEAKKANPNQTGL